jgi:DNA-binding transcriptional regulator YiaG
MVSLMTMHLDSSLSVIDGGHSSTTTAAATEAPAKRPPQTLRDLRLSRGLSQGDLAKAMEVSQQYVSKIERGASFGPKAIRNFATALGIDTERVYDAWQASRSMEMPIW